MKLNERAVFKWVLIFSAAALTVIALRLVAGSLVAALWALVLAIAGCIYLYRWAARKWRQS